MTQTEPIAQTVAKSPPFRLSISATFTAEPVEPFLRFWARVLHAPLEVRFAPYNQVVQTLLAPGSAFASNSYGLNVLLLRLVDFGEIGTRSLEENLQELVRSVRTASTSLSSPLLVCHCPGPTGFGSPEMEQRSESFLQSAFHQVPGVQFLDYREIEQLYPVPLRDNPEGERLGRIPYTDAWFCALGTALVRRARAIFQPPYKVIALDCDNTLWQGICGEDGPQGVVLDPARRALHEFMLAQREAGVLLAMASKNNEEDVLETFHAHPEMPLRPEHFTAWRINWRSKAENLAEMAEELNLGLDSFIFIDDNPKEAAEVAEGVPEVLALTLPFAIEEMPRYLEHVWAFDHPVVTREDRNRSASYAQQQEFGEERRRASSLADFLAKLDLRVTVSELQPDTVDRVAQLTQRTNQFNCTTVRRTAPEIRALLDQGRLECRTVDVSDRFGHYGLVGVMLFHRTAEEIAVDTLLLSCRALGRGVEHRMLAWLGKLAKDAGLKTVSVPFHPTPKNLPALEFLQSTGKAWRTETASGLVFRFPADQILGLEWKPSAGEAQPASPRRRLEPAPRRQVEYERIALELSSAGQILARVRQEHTDLAALSHGSEIEHGLAAIWSELLEKRVVSHTANFFDLGGHSLLAVLLLLRIRERFGVDLMIDDVYSGTATLAGMARKIEAKQLGELDPGEYQALLAEVEGLSDDEVARLLAESEEGRL